MKISNLMRVLGEEAVQDPTAIEQQVRDQMAERQQAHDDRNEARKLTPAERREKKHAQLVGELGADTLVAVYRVCHRPASTWADHRCGPGMWHAFLRLPPVRISNMNSDALSCTATMPGSCPGIEIRWGVDSTAPPTMQDHARCTRW